FIFILRLFSSRASSFSFRMGSPTRGPWFWESQPPVVGLKLTGSRAQQEFTHVGRNGWAFLGRGYKAPLSFPPELLYILCPNDLWAGSPKVKPLRGPPLK